MGKHKSNKHKNSSEGSGAQQKNARNGGSPVNVSVSDSLRQANSVLFDGNNDETNLKLDNSVFEPGHGHEHGHEHDSSLSSTIESKSPSVISGGMTLYHLLVIWTY